MRHAINPLTAPIIIVTRRQRADITRLAEVIPRDDFNEAWAQREDFGPTRGPEGVGLEDEVFGIGYVGAVVRGEPGGYWGHVARWGGEGGEVGCVAGGRGVGGGGGPG